MKTDNFFASAFETPITMKNPRGAGRKKENNGVLYRRIPVAKKDRIAKIVDAAIANDEFLTGLEWLLSQFPAR